MNIQFGKYELEEVGSINVVLGKNGSGKSTLLRELENTKRNVGYCRYITPERGGVLNRDGNVETNIAQGTWLSDVRRRNRFEQFRQISVAEFRRLETLVLRKIEKTPALRANVDYTFDTTVADINTLLESVELVRSPDGGFQVRNRGGGAARDNDTLSSGESELISLAIEILAYAFASEDEQYAATENWLLIDEPDVHLHPDLQQRLMALLVRATKARPFRVCIATHSTSIVSSLADLTDLQVAFMGKAQFQLRFEPASPALKAVMPIFGAHPLSNVFNERPILLVEGDDDERIWQQAVRTSEGKIKAWPCVAGSVQNLNIFEQKAVSVLNAVYENAKAYSLRDRDEAQYEIGDVGPMVRSRLFCRAAENLLLSDDVLQLLKTNWEDLVAGLEKWLLDNSNHPQTADVRAFRDGGWNRRDTNVKAIRNLVLAVIGTQKPWEVAVGQAIAVLKVKAHNGPNSLASYLGPKVVEALALHP